MILYYAMGGGLGHLVRARAVVHTLALAEPVALLTAAPDAADRRIVGGMQVLQVPLTMQTDLHAYRAWLRSLLAQLAPSALYLDAFPAGIQYELCDGIVPGRVPIYHLARLLRWQRYHSGMAGTPPPLTLTYQLEPLDPLHAAFLQRYSDAVVPLTLRDPPALPHALPRAWHHAERPRWLVVHAGAECEIAELLTYAETLAHYAQVEPLLLLVARRRPAWLPPHVLHCHHYPAAPLFPLADAIITAGGFNVMRQGEAYHHKHHVMPFPRHFDDQFVRVARWRSQHRAIHCSEHSGH